MPNDANHGSAWWQPLLRELEPELRGLRVAVYGSGGAPYHHAGLAALWGTPPQPLSATSIRSGVLDRFDVVIFPGGGARAMSGMLDPLGTDGASAVREWVARGGMYVGSCAGSFLPAIVGDAYWSAHPEARELHMVCARLANGSDSEWEGLTSPGVGVLDMEVTEPDHWLTHGLPDRFRLVHYNGPMFVPYAREGEDPLLGQTVGVARFATRTRGFTASEAFLDPTADAATVFDHGVNVGASSAVAASYGQGTVVLYGSHPEFGFDAIQLGWGEGVRLFANALRYQAGRRRTSAARTERAAPDVGGDAALRATIVDLAERFAAHATRFSGLTAHATAPWLRVGCVPGFMGLDPVDLWRKALERAAEVCSGTSQYLCGMAADESVDLGSAANWIDEAAPAGQDYGFMGLRQLADSLESKLDAGIEALASDPGCLQQAYADLDEHPYQILVSSYLSAAGLASCAALSATVVGAHARYTGAAPVGPTDDPIART